MKPPVLALPFAALHALSQRAAQALHALHHGSPALAWAGWLHVALALAATLLLAADHRLVTGAPAWLKPLKFALSGLAYTWALGWVLASLPGGAQRAVAVVGWGVALSMVVEIVVIFIQAGRGVSSHYNTSSPLNALLFGTMGIFILANTVLTGWAVFLVWHYRVAGSEGYVWGVRLGLLLFLVGSVLGGLMIRQLGHTVGAPDGGPGLPGLGWSTRAGDLRAAHFLGLHALQALPLLGWAFDRWQPARAVPLLWVGTALYVAAVVALLAQALAGQPLWRAR